MTTSTYSSSGTTFTGELESLGDEEHCCWDALTNGNVQVARVRMWSGARSPGGDALVVSESFSEHLHMLARCRDASHVTGLIVVACLSK